MRVALFTCLISIACTPGGAGPAGIPAQAAIDASVGMATSVSLADGSVYTTIRWSISTRPAESVAQMMDADHAQAWFVPDRVGAYIATATLTDIFGKTATVDVAVTASRDCTQLVDGIDSAQGSVVALPRASTTEGCSNVLAAYRWSLKDAPPGSVVVLPATDRTVRLDAGGAYHLAYVATPLGGAALPERMFEIRAMSCAPVPVCVASQMPTLGLRAVPQNHSTSRTNLRVDATSPCGRAIASVNVSVESAPDQVNVTLTGGVQAPPGTFRAETNSKLPTSGVVKLRCSATDALGVEGTTFSDAPLVPGHPVPVSLLPDGYAFDMLANDVPLIVGSDLQGNMVGYELDRPKGAWKATVIDGATSALPSKGLRSAVVASGNEAAVVYLARNGTVGELRFAARSTSGMWTVRALPIAAATPPDAAAPYLATMQLLRDPVSSAYHLLVATYDGLPQTLTHYTCVSDCGGSGAWSNESAATDMASTVFYPMLSGGTLYIGYLNNTSGLVQIRICSATNASCVGASESGGLNESTGTASSFYFTINPATSKPAVSFYEYDNFEWVNRYRECAADCSVAASWTPAESISTTIDYLVQFRTIAFASDGSLYSFHGLDYQGTRTMKRSAPGMWLPLQMSSAPLYGVSSEARTFTVVPSATGGFRTLSWHGASQTTDTNGGYWEWEP